MNVTRIISSSSKSSISKRWSCFSTISKVMNSEDISSFKFKTKEDLISNPPKTAFNRKVADRKLYLIQGYYERLQSPLVMVYQHNNLNVPEYRALQQQVAKLGCRVQTTRTGIMKTALRDSPFEAMRTLFNGPTLIIYAHDLKEGETTSSAAKKVHDSLAKNKKLIFIGAKAEQFLFSEATFSHFMSLPSLQTLQAQLLGSLQVQPSRLISLLGQESQLLSRLLTQHKENQESK
ncbi:hypothetical protein K502DRAFT_302634 [Neoconidiobolus thromboides FSU 785]|nr:hypothetical protein K502DRAFT_302634 [Neoconidiobolus thromboides FSU 785]